MGLAVTVSFGNRRPLELTEEVRVGRPFAQLELGLVRRAEEVVPCNLR